MRKSIVTVTAVLCLSFAAAGLAQTDAIRL